MIDVDAGGTDARARRRTWMLGGGLLAASALLNLWVASSPGAPVGIVPGLFFAAGAIVFAIGLGQSGSVTARRPLGTGVLVGLGVWLLVQPMIHGLLMPPDPMADMVDWGARAQLMGMVVITLEVVSPVLAILAVVQIGRSGVVPAPWNWAPLWALVVVVAARLLAMGLLAVPVLTDSPDVLNAVISLAAFIGICAVGALGVLAMVLAARPVAGSTSVYSSGE